MLIKPLLEAAVAERTQSAGEAPEPALPRGSARDLEPIAG
jgi:hypothetical protein